MDVELIHNPGRDNLAPDALSHREELLIPRLLVLVEEDLGVREAMKHDDEDLDEVVIINNRFFDERVLKKNVPGGRRMKNLRRKNGLHYFKQIRLYVPEGELRKRILHEFYDTPLAGYKGVRATMADF